LEAGTLLCHITPPKRIVDPIKAAIETRTLIPSL